jgi:hypothetical protein
MRNLSRGLLPLVVVLALFAGTFAAGQDQPKAIQPIRLPGPGVADPAGKIGYFPSVSGGIDALDLATGKLLWTSKDAGRPLLATADRLFAHKDVAGKANQFRLVVLDATKGGKKLVETEPITLPYWVSVSVAYGRSYRSGARLEGDNLYIAWDAHAFYAGGARPTPEIERAERKDATGVVRIEVATGKVAALDQDKIKAGNFFPVAGDVPSAKAGEWTLSYKDGPARNAKSPFARMRTLQAVNAAQQLVWEREIAAPVFLPPRP